MDMILYLRKKILSEKDNIENHLKLCNNFINGIVQNILYEAYFNQSIDKIVLHSLYNNEILEPQEANLFLLNNIELISKYNECLNNQCIEFNNLSLSLSIFVRNFNSKIVDNLKIVNDNISFVDYDNFMLSDSIIDFFDKNKHISYFDFEIYLFNIYCFYRSLSLIIENFEKI